MFTYFVYPLKNLKSAAKGWHKDRCRLELKFELNYFIRGIQFQLKIILFAELVNLSFKIILFVIKYLILSEMYL